MQNIFKEPELHVEYFPFLSYIRHLDEVTTTGFTDIALHKQERPVKQNLDSEVIKKLNK